MLYVCLFVCAYTLTSPWCVPQFIGNFQNLPRTPLQNVSITSGRIARGSERVLSGLLFFLNFKLFPNSHYVFQVVFVFGKLHSNVCCCCCCCCCCKAWRMWVGFQFQPKLLLGPSLPLSLIALRVGKYCKFWLTVAWRCMYIHIYVCIMYYTKFTYISVYVYTYV